MVDTWINSNIRIGMRAYSLRNPFICKHITSIRVSCVHSEYITYGFSPAKDSWKTQKPFFHLKNAFHFVWVQSGSLIISQFTHIWHQTLVLESQGASLCVLGWLFAWHQISWLLNIWIFVTLLLISVTSSPCLCMKLQEISHINNTSRIQIQWEYIFSILVIIWHSNIENDKEGMKDLKPRS